MSLRRIFVEITKTDRINNDGPKIVYTKKLGVYLTFNKLPFLQYKIKSNGMCFPSPRSRIRTNLGSFMNILLTSEFSPIFCLKIPIL